MKILLWLSYLFAFEVSASCRFNSQATKVYSLSGPITLALREINLLKEVKGVSIFHPLSTDEYKGTILPGGVFLSSQNLNSFSNSVVFFDESRELEKALKTIKSVQAVEVITRALTPHEVTLMVVKTLSTYLIDCEKELKKLTQTSLSLQAELVSRIPAKMKVIFYLGDFQQGRKPELVIANDGVVKMLREKKAIETYPSELAYVNWSMKEMGKLARDTIHVGIKDSARELTMGVVKRSTFEETLLFPGSLIPGMSQLKAWLYWIDHR